MKNKTIQTPPPKLSAALKKWFRQRILSWHEVQNARHLPWKSTKDPYTIWVAEVIMQQTQVVQGTPYFLKFIAAYPNVFYLAKADEDEVFKIWQGLGYYSRCRNMRFAARQIVEDYDGVFPESYSELRKLKGVGDYTAAAIASFAFDLPHAVVDGNVYRVLSRFFSIEEPVDGNTGKKLFAELAQDLLDKNRAAEYNQAMMDLGSTVCKPKNPKCSLCPLSEKCEAFSRNMIEFFPIKNKKITKKNRQMHYLILEKGDEIFVVKRKANDIWQSLYELILMKDNAEANHLITNFLGKKIEPIQSVKHLLTHQVLNLSFYRLRLPESTKIKLENKGQWVKKDELTGMAFPQPIFKFLKKILYF